MGNARKPDLDRRLEAYFSIPRSSLLRERLKRGMESWQLYAAVGGSAVAMATGASASLISSAARTAAPDPVASVRAARQLGSSRVPLLHDIRLAMAREDAPPLSRDARPSLSAAVPFIASAGIGPVFGATGVIQSGEWISIYGSSLATVTATWNGDFPISLGGTRVTINGRPAYLSYVSPTQINAQAPDDTASGPVTVVVTTAAGSATASVTLGPYAPSFSVLNRQFVAGIILRLDRTGAYGGGTYDILGPTGSLFGYLTRAARPGDIVELFGVGFGPTTPVVPAGKPFSGAARITSGFSLTVNNITVEPSFVGLSSAGLDQINLLVPDGLGEGEVPIMAHVGGMATQPRILFSLESGGAGTSSSAGYAGTYGGGGTGGAGFGPGGGTGGGSGGGTGGGMGGGTGGGMGGGTGGGSGGGGSGGGGSGGGGSAALRPAPYLPKLRFTPTVENA